MNKNQKQAVPQLPIQKLTESIKPQKLVMKYEPPIIGILYTVDVPGQKPKRHIYNILLNDLINNPNTEEITAQLFMEHQDYLNENIVSFAQIHNLVMKIQDYFINLANMDEEQMQQYQAMRAQQMGYPQGLEDLDLENMDEEQLQQLYLYQQQQQQAAEMQQQQQQPMQGSGKKQGGRKKSF